MEQITAYYLRNREEVLAKAIEMARTAQTHLFGMGRDLSWLSDPDFKEAVGSHITVREGGCLDMLVIAARKDRVAQAYARQFYHDIKAKVGFADFGQVRVVVSDGERLLLGFPAAPGLAEGVNEVAFGLYIEHPRFTQWLEQRFLSKYGKSQKLEQNVLQDCWQWVENHKEQVVVSLAISLFWFLVGLFAR